MISPWMAFSHWGLVPRKKRAGPIEPSSATPIRRPGEGAAAAGDRHAADDHRGDHLELQAGAGIGVDVGEADGVQQRRQARQRAHDHEDAERHAPGADAGQPGGLGVRAGRIDRPPGREVCAGPRRTPRRPRARSPPPATGRPTARRRTTGSPAAGRGRIPPRAGSGATRGRSPAWRASPRSTAAPAPPRAPPLTAPKRTAGHERPQPDHRHRQARAGQQPGDHAADAEDRADRDVDLAAEDHQRHPHRRHQHRRIGDHQRPELARRGRTAAPPRPGPGARPRTPAATDSSRR